MAQIKIFGIREQLHPIREKVSQVIHECVVEAFHYPKEKKAHRFLYIDKDSFFYFDGRTDKHTIIEISVFEGRSIEAKKKLHRLLFEKFENELGITPIDLEITIFEPQCTTGEFAAKAVTSFNSIIKSMFDSVQNIY